MAGQLTIDSLKASTGVLATQNGMTGICKAWVNFVGSSSPTPAGSFNVSSITYNQTGDFTINFTTAMPNATYSVVGSSQIDTTSAYLTTSGSDGLLSIKRGVATPLTTSSARIGTGSTNNTLVNCSMVCVAIFSS